MKLTGPDRTCRVLLVRRVLSDWPVRSVWRGLLLGALVAAVSGAPAAHGMGTTVIASEGRFTELSAYGGVVVWSSYSPELRRYRLTALRGGRVVQLPVRSRRVPFDADVGPDRRGRPQVVYSRCRREPQVFPSVAPNYESGRGCRFWRFSFRDGVERRIRGAAVAGYTAFRPSVSGRRLFYGLSRQRGESLSTQFRLLSLRSGRRKAVPVLVRSSLTRKAQAGTFVTGLDLSGTRVTVGLRHNDVPCGRPSDGDKVGPEASEIFAGPATRVRRIVAACDASDRVRAQAPSWHRGDIFALLYDRVDGRLVQRLHQLSVDGRTLGTEETSSVSGAAAVDETGRYFVVERSPLETGKKESFFDIVKQ